ncbi:FAD:protein FMN transferase [Thermogutta sp.]|uniref:FAD:protein FMN transferase n=1 Tax=Thermogutta sp. TaxID=1962930 RepID=UPI00321FF5BA
MATESNRRDFLRRLTRGQLEDPGEPIGVPADSDASNASPAGTRSSTPRGGAYKLQLGRRAMASDFQAIFNLGQYENAVEVALTALDLLEPLEDMMSFFRPKGELGRINAEAFHRDVEVSSELWNLLVYCRQLWEATEGAFDITAAPLWQVWGFARREGRLPHETEIMKARELCGWRWVEMDASRQTVRFHKPGVAFNLGSVGKGYALDRLAKMIAEAGIQDFALHGGLSSVFAMGNSWEPTLSEHTESPQGWPIGLRDPLHPGRRFGRVWLKCQGLGTSGTALQFFWHKGKRYGHILDPRTGYPADEVLSVTVLAPTAAEADALATAFFILGPDGARRFCEQHPNVTGVFLCNASQGPPQVEVVGSLQPDMEIDERQGDAS